MIAWQTKEAIGFPIAYHERAMEAYGKHGDGGDWSFVDYAINNTIGRYGLFVGVIIIMPTIGGAADAAVFHIDGIKAYAVNKEFTYFLQYDEDRKCWVCIGGGKMDAINKLTIGEK